MRKVAKEFHNASSDLEAVIVMILEKGQYALADLSQDLQDGLLARALELRCVDAAAQLLRSGARIENLKRSIDPSLDLEAFKSTLEEAVNLSTSLASAPVDFDENMKKAKEGLKATFTRLGL